MSNKPAYEVNEKVIARDSLGSNYESKVLQVDVSGDAPLYYVHYDGWNARWDEWIPGDRMMKLTEENKVLAKLKIKKPSGKKPKDAFQQPAAAAVEEERAEANAESDEEEAPAEEPKRRKRVRPAAHRGPSLATEIVVKIPPALKRVLYEDWRNVTTQGFLVSLPRRPSVFDVLNQYLADVLAGRKGPKGDGAGTNEEEVVLREVVGSFGRYFDRALGLLLLYKQERLQYRTLLESYPNVRLSQLYGSEHLLRMFVKLPEIVSSGSGLHSMPSEVILLLNSHIELLLQYLTHRVTELFGDYENATPEYVRYTWRLKGSFEEEEGLSSAVVAPACRRLQGQPAGVLWPPMRAGAREQNAQHDARFREQIEGQMSRLMQQLADLEEFKGDLEKDEYAETLQDTKDQLKEFKEALDKITEGDVTLLDTLARMKMAIQAAISDAFKTPEVIGMFTQKQPGQLRQRLLALDQALKLRKITPESYNDQRVEVLSALQKLGEDLTAQELQFLEQNMTRAMRDFEKANEEINAGVLSLAGNQIKTAQAPK